MKNILKIYLIGFIAETNSQDTPSKSDYITERRDRTQIAVPSSLLELSI